MNSRIKALLLEHFTNYPKMKIQDMVKLIYQNEFAGGHFIRDEAESLKRLKAEIEGLKTGNSNKSDSVLFEDIGNGLVRLYLYRLPYLQANIDTINRFFIYTSNRVRGNAESFEKKAAVFRQCCEDGSLPFEAEEADRLLKSLKAEGYPPVSHSDDYRKEYNPCYRVVLSEYRTFFHLFSAIDSLLKSKETVNVAIDGNSGAGKSTLADLISHIYDCNLFHTDDFFLTPELRTEERLKEPGGNVDYVRFRREILDPIRTKRDFTYSRYNCSTGTFDRPVHVCAKRLNIVEGSYSIHPYLADAYDLKVFLHIDKERQQARILERNGEEMLERFIHEWIPLEDQYFQQMQIPEKCNLVYEL